jgi:cytochrome c
VTPLHIAALSGRTAMIAPMLEHGGDVHLRTREKGLTPLHEACRSGDTTALLLLLDHGADVHDVDSNGMTPLHYGVVGGPPMVRILLEHGASPSARDRRGRTPRMYAERIYPDSNVMLERARAAARYLRSIGAE